MCSSDLAPSTIFVSEAEAVRHGVHGRGERRRGLRVGRVGVVAELVVEEQFLERRELVSQVETGGKGAVAQKRK